MTPPLPIHSYLDGTEVVVTLDVDGDGAPDATVRIAPDEAFAAAVRMRAVSRVGVAE